MKIYRFALVLPARSHFSSHEATGWFGRKWNRVQKSCVKSENESFSCVQSLQDTKDEFSEQFKLLITKRILIKFDDKRRARVRLLCAAN